MTKKEKKTIKRVQLGVRMEASTVKVLKAVAQYCGLSLGELLEGIVSHSFECPGIFEKELLQHIENLKKIYDMKP